MALEPAYPTPASALTTMAEWEAFFRGMSLSGVIPGIGNEFSPSINSGARTVTISTGAALVRGFYVAGGSATATGVPTQDAQNRIDRLVLRLDRTAVTAADWITPVIIEGAASATPQPPARASSETGSWDLPICRWTSASTGALSGLVDERYWVESGNLLTIKSTERPSPRTVTIAREWDTGRTVVWDGSTWRALFEDTGWVNITAAGFWNEGDFALRTRKVGSVVHLKGQIRRTTNTLQSSDSDSPVATLTSAFRPIESHLWIAYVTGGGQALMRIYP